MNLQTTPMRWPATWKDPAAVARLSGTGIDRILLDAGADLGSVAAAAQKAGIVVADPAASPAGVRIVKGEWPGIQLSQHGGDGSSAGPTGVPWVDSNGWKVRLEAALHPRDAVWVEATPKAPRLATGAYTLAVADAAAHGGRWIVSLDDALAAAIAAGDEQALTRWKELTAATGFFASRAAWAGDTPQAVVGVISTFTGANEFLSHEVLNLLARANQQYRILVKGSSPDYSGLRALLYVDPDPLPPDLHGQMLTFAAAGGLLIVGPKWGGSTGALVHDGEHPRYDIHAAGKGRIAIAKAPPEDPFLLASDSVVLVSHRYELLRFWNCGAVGSFLTASADRKRTLAQLVFYANRGPSDASVRITGRYRSANLWTMESPAPRKLEVHGAGDGIEVHLPAMNQYAAIELEV